MEIAGLRHGVLFVPDGSVMTDDRPDIEDAMGAAGLSPQEETPSGHRSGFVAVVGRPNVGKSTLMNALLGEKVAIVSPKPQTTRTNQLGILTRPDAQVVFVDTPGIHVAKNKLGQYMVEAATEAIPDADAVLFLVDLTDRPNEADQIIAHLVREQSTAPVILGMNKADAIKPAQALPHQAAYHDLIREAEPITFSAATRDNLDKLLDMLIEALPEGPRYFPPDQLTDTHVRNSVAELIREKAMLRFQEEIPHAVAVQVEEFKERTDNLTYVAATIYVERDSQKAILIGKGGQALKKLGEIARNDLEQVLGTKVYLDLWVKVLKNWRKDARALKRLGYHRRQQ